MKGSFDSFCSFGSVLDLVDIDYILQLQNSQNINLIKMIEEGILQNGILTKEDIEEIHRVFVMMDQEGTGNISVAEIRNLAATISKNPNISMDEAYTVHGLIDKNKDGKV